MELVEYSTQKVEFRELTNGLDFPEGPIALPDGSLLVVEIRGKTLTRVSASGELSVVAQLEGGPNGAAMGPDGHCYICNSGGWYHRQFNGLYYVSGQAPESGWIERVDLASGSTERLYTECEGRFLRSPNDLVFDRTGGFYFTDSGKADHYHRDVTAIYYARPDGSSIVEVARPLLTPNGIGLSPDERILYVAETHTRRLLAFSLLSPGVIDAVAWPESINGGRALAGLPDRFALDSLAIDCEGNICVAALIDGGIWEISPDGKRRTHYPLPDPYSTNICFGGEDLQTAFVTLSGSGRLISFRWPRPGLPLNFLNTSAATESQ
jgi:gluconolactonase